MGAVYSTPDLSFPLVLVMGVVCCVFEFESLEYLGWFWKSRMADQLAECNM